MDLSEPVQEYDFTKKAYQNMKQTVDSYESDDVDADAILKHLLHKMELVPFSAYLKRDIYLRSGMTEPFHSVPDKLYEQIVRNSFAERNAPFSVFQGTRSRTVIIRTWLTNNTIKRISLFPLGFGLGMSDRDVSYFLTKVLCERDFDFTNEMETIFWYCFRTHSPYSKEAELRKYYEDIDVSNMIITEDSLHITADLPYSSRFDLSDEAQLREYLVCLKALGIQEKSEAVAYRHFKRLLLETKEAIAKFFSEGADYDPFIKPVSAEDISIINVADVLYAGIEKDRFRNQKSIAKSTLSKYFKKNRLTRQKLNSLLNRRFAVSHADLITLIFYLSAQKWENERPDDRCRMFVDEANAILADCRMMEIYPVNPYHSFLMMCLLTEDPMTSFSDVWALSFEEEQLPALLSDRDLSEEKYRIVNDKTSGAPCTR